MIFYFAGNFAPSGWMVCNGQLLPIASYNALFALLGTNYGGNGVTTFGLPDLRGRIPMHVSTTHPQGEVAGSETVQLNQVHIPIHTHAFNAVNLTGGKVYPGPQHFLGYSPVDKMYSLDAVNTTLAPTSIASSGGGTSMSIMGPYLALTPIIAVTGIFPSRN
jgi:microcystin-dependent protein